MTATGSIICGVDGSESAKGAARVASTLSARLGLPLLFVCVVEARTTDHRGTRDFAGGIVRFSLGSRRDAS